MKTHVKTPRWIALLQNIENGALSLGDTEVTKEAVDSSSYDGEQKVCVFRITTTVEIV